MKYNGLEIHSYDKSEIQGNIDYMYHIRGKTGQVKLILTEIELITHLKNKNVQVSPFTVCGGAPGIHYYTLSKMYPEIKFVLYDKRPFYSRLKECSNVQTINKYVSQENVHELNGVFVSDIRSLEINENKENFEIHSNIILRDMYEQLLLFSLSKCEHGMIKFKIPINLHIPYLPGILLVQPFINTNELRLIVDKSNITKVYYDGESIDKHCQMINNHWKSAEKILCDNKIMKIIDDNKFHPKWDTIAMIDILMRANKLDFLSDIVKMLKK